MTQDEVNRIYMYLHQRFEYRKDGVLIDKKTKNAWFGYESRNCKKLSYETTIRIKSYKYHISYSHLIFIYHHKIKPSFVEFINKNPVDTRIENMKEITMSKRNLTIEGNERNKHGFRGIVKDNHRYGARIMIKGKYKYISWHDRPEDAYKAYLEAKEDLIKNDSR